MHILKAKQNDIVKHLVPSHHGEWTWCHLVVPDESNRERGSIFRFLKLHTTAGIKSSDRRLVMAVGFGRDAYTYRRPPCNSIQSIKFDSNSNSDCGRPCTWLCDRSLTSHLSVIHQLLRTSMQKLGDIRQKKVLTRSRHDHCAACRRQRPPTQRAGVGRNPGPLWDSPNLGSLAEARRILFVEMYQEPLSVRFRIDQPIPQTDGQFTDEETPGRGG